MSLKNPIISVPEFERLVVDLLEKEPGISMRYRLIGEMWYHSFVKVINIEEKEVTLMNEITGKQIFIASLSSIIQFELDGRFQSFQPYFHYEVAIRPQFILM